MKRYDPSYLPEFRSALKSVLEKDPRIQFAFLHGSAQQGLPFRDLDIAVQIQSQQPDYVVVGEIAERLERVVNAPVDVHSLKGAPPLIAFQVSHGELLHCANRSALAQWREDTWNRYFRYQPHQERLLADWLSRSDEGAPNALD